jgi:hypothetical protein
MKTMQIAALAACLAMPSIALAQKPDEKNSKAVQEIVDFRN